MRSGPLSLAARLAAIDVSEHPGACARGPLEIETLVHDLASSTSTTRPRAAVSSAQSIQGVGYYATTPRRRRGRVDFTSIMRVRVMYLRPARPSRDGGGVQRRASPSTPERDDPRRRRGRPRRVGDLFPHPRFRAPRVDFSAQVDRTADHRPRARCPSRSAWCRSATDGIISLDLGFTLTRSELIGRQRQRHRIRPAPSP